MGLSQLAPRCRVCPYVESCDHKQMVALGYLPLPESTVEIQVDQAVEIDIALDQISRLFQIPKRYLRGDEI